MQWRISMLRQSSCPRFESRFATGGGKLKLELRTRDRCSTLICSTTTASGNGYRGKVVSADKQRSLSGNDGWSNEGYRGQSGGGYLYAERDEQAVDGRRRGDRCLRAILQRTARTRCTSLRCR